LASVTADGDWLRKLTAFAEYYAQRQHCRVDEPRDARPAEFMTDQ
jgi:hypothetical protein